MTLTPKKTEKLEVRLSPAAKVSFLAYCQSQGGSASEVVRALIAAQLAQPTSAPVPAVTRALSVLCGLAAAGLALAVLSGAVLALRNGLRTGLTVFLVVEGVVYAAAALATFKLEWRRLSGLLLVQGLLQTVYATEVDPAASTLDAASGVLIGMLSPTLALAIVAMAAWASMRRNRPKISMG